MDISISKSSVYTQNRFGQPEAALSCPGCVDIPTAVGFSECTLQVVNICCTFGIVLVAYMYCGQQLLSERGEKKSYETSSELPQKQLGGNSFYPTLTAAQLSDV